MKKALLLLLLSSFSAFSQLSGNYIVGTAQPSPFNTLTSAVSHLNSVGVSGPVVFLLDNAVYSDATGETFPISINQFSGASAANTFTIRPNTGKTVLVKADNINAFTPMMSVIKLNGADHVTIDGSNNGGTSKDLTINNGNTLTYSKRAVIWLANATTTNGSNNNIVKNVILEQFSTAGAWSMGIYAAGTAMNDNAATAANSNNTINNVTFIKAGQGVYIYGSATAATQSQYWTISNSTFGSSSDAGKGFLGIYLSNIKNYTVTANTLDGFLKSTTAYSPLNSGIYTTGICSNGTISFNKIDNVRETTGAGATGIFVTGNNTSVYNNMVNNVRANGNGGNSNNGFGIYIHSGQAISLYHNSVRLVTSQSSGISAALFVNGGTQLDIRNNIFVNSQANGPTRYAIYSLAAATAYSSIDYNDYFSEQHVGYLGNNKNGLAQWQTATGKDAHSINVQPVFTSATDLHLIADNNTAIDNFATPLTLVPTDIDSQTRSTSTPDMGADEFSAPLCPSSTTWNGTAWSNGNPSLTLKAIINGNYDTASGSIKACELIVNAAATVTVRASDYIEVQNNISVLGSLIIEDKGSVVQNDDDAVHSGNVTIKRKTSPLKQYDYTYWSAPVAGTTMNVLATPSIYYLFSPEVNNYLPQTASSVMTVGRGYIARAPNNLSYTSPQVIEATFNGVPNTGVISVPVVKSAGVYNLIGNPYPSPIDADEFLVDPANANYIGGTIYLWTHNTAISMQNQGTQTYNYARDDYAKYNVTGGVKTGSAAANSSVTPMGKIASGQGFFIEALQDGTHNIEFRNSMRTKGNGNNGQFFRDSDEAQAERTAPMEKHRIWVSISNTFDAYDETLLGYITGATNGLDRAFDGKTFPAGNVVGIYSILAQDNLAIQGRSLPFSQQDVIPIGYVCAIGGEFSIRLEQFDGLFADQEVYLLDKTTGIYHDLKNAMFTFNSVIGTFNDRFELHFTTQQLGVSNPTMANGISMISQNGNILINSDEDLKSVNIYDITGKLLYSRKTISGITVEMSGLNADSQLLLVKILMGDGKIFTGKVMND